MMPRNEASSELCTKHLNAYVEELQSLLRTHNIPFPTISDHRRTLFDSSQSACDWELKEKIGEGFRGAVYEACTPKTYVVKEQPIGDEDDANAYFNEIEKLQALRDWKYAPVILDAWVEGDKGYYAMERLHPCFNHPISAEEIRDIFHDLHNNKNFTHNDVHFDNVMCTRDGTLKIIDWGEALEEKEVPKTGKIAYWGPTHSQRIAVEEKRIEPMIAFFQVLRLQRELYNSQSSAQDQDLVDKINETIRLGRMQLEQSEIEDLTLKKILDDLPIESVKELLAY